MNNERNTFLEDLAQLVEKHQCQFSFSHDADGVYADLPSNMDMGDGYDFINLGFSCSTANEYASQLRDLKSKKSPLESMQDIKEIINSSGLPVSVWDGDNCTLFNVFDVGYLPSEDKAVLNQDNLLENKYECGECE